MLVAVELPYLYDRPNFQCRGVLLIWSRVGQGITPLAVGAGGGC